MKLFWLILAVPFLTGCIVVPVPHPESLLHARPGVSGAKDWSFVEPGITTWEQIVLRFGEPDYRWSDDEVMVYHWVTTEWLILWAVGTDSRAAGGAYDVPIGHFLLLHVDGERRITLVEEKHDSGWTIISAKELKKKTVPQVADRGGP